MIVGVAVSTTRTTAAVVAAAAAGVVVAVVVVVGEKVSAMERECSWVAV